MLRGILLFIVALTASAYTQQDVQLCRGFLPPNNMYIPDDGLHVMGIDKSKFEDVLDRIEKVYTPIIQQKGGVLKVDRRWSDGTVNAYADRAGRTWKIVMFGGFARHPAVTYDGFMAVACHELGHHIGGAPKYRADWASVEGESDYFGNLKCLKRMFESDDNQKILADMELDPIAVSECKAQHRSQQDELVCIRATMAALSLAKVLAEGTDVVPKLDTPDKSEVNHTDSDHPAAQCRLDTLYEAALCDVPFAQDVDDRDYQVGTCFTPTHVRGARSRCWFKPN